ncbi:hypothetical protein STSP2_00125 [Anaerohalosphaera lusitana]|uniref:Uncharacterized protein n=1 Tax=Anaerohalosphaera lusitana TaxID=1936003 RepID=A0A1U9NGU7_9BACT|nr:hypothetical protein [Anaerohalosphaera lusitana]AQT66987.1 hypothetical protein STSP2_00125 [Anaerohalosphaera lusitana]
MSKKWRIDIAGVSVIVCFVLVLVLLFSYARSSLDQGIYNHAVERALYFARIFIVLVPAGMLLLFLFSAVRKHFGMAVVYFIVTAFIVLQVPILVSRSFRMTYDVTSGYLMTEKLGRAVEVFCERPEQAGLPNEQWVAAFVKYAEAEEIWPSNLERCTFNDAIELTKLSSQPGDVFVFVFSPYDEENPNAQKPLLANVSMIEGWKDDYLLLYRNDGEIFRYLPDEDCYYEIDRSAWPLGGQ